MYPLLFLLTFSVLRAFVLCCQEWILSVAFWNAFQAEEERIRKEEEERREQEEYLKLKEAFSIEEEGEEDVGPDLSVSCLPLITERMALICF